MEGKSVVYHYWKRHEGGGCGQGVLKRISVDMGGWAMVLVLGGVSYRGGGRAKGGGEPGGRGMLKKMWGGDKDTVRGGRERHFFLPHHHHHHTMPWQCCQRSASLPPTPQKQLTFV